MPGAPAIAADAARHRIELDTALTHRPLGTLDDELAAGNDDPRAHALWLAHRRRAAELTRQLRLKLPAAGLARRDPWGFRAALALILIVGGVAAGQDSFDRLGRALVPEINALIAGTPVDVTLWITPPAYTGAAPICVAAWRRR